MKKRFLFIARYYSIEPLGIHYLAGIVRDADWVCNVVLVKENEFKSLYDIINKWKPDMVGCQILTGFHIHAFLACDTIRAMGIPVVIGGPHATYFSAECVRHADFVVQGSGFRILRSILTGIVSKGVHFDRQGRDENFPIPNRDLIYETYPEFGASPIKSIIGSVGCPMTCTYCYAPTFNEMHGGFRLIVRSVSELITEIRTIMYRWPLVMVYWQDDIFGYDMRWLEEFAKRWPIEVGVTFHCQIRLELTSNDIGSKRLDLLKLAGCSGITLAIESGNEFLRDRVLFRHMSEDLIIEGCRKIMDRGMTLRTEQILAVPFSDTLTDLSTLDLSAHINPEMAWISILAPYGGTNMSKIASNFGLYTGNNDDLSDNFFDRSILQHVARGTSDIERIVESLGIHPKAPPSKQPLLQLHAFREGNIGNVMHNGIKLGTIEYLDEITNKRYCDNIVRLQRLFNWLSKIPNAEQFASRLLSIPESEWNWEAIGKTAIIHLRYYGYGCQLEDWSIQLAQEMGITDNKLPEPIAQNPVYFVFFHEGGILAHKALESGVFDKSLSTLAMLDNLSTITRRHLFYYSLYKLEVGKSPIAI